ncbi:unnamed protein product [Effrenium voratum]|nr:unnamed protein product [Effrenium voratum]
MEQVDTASFDNLDEFVPKEPVRCISEKSLPIHDPVAVLIGFMTAMDIARPEIVRTTAAYQTLKSCSAAFRSGDRDFFPTSQQSERIQEFWSHSWQERAWKKSLTLMVLNNGLPAVLLGSIGSCMGMVLFLYGALPGYPRHAARHVPSSVWSQSLGLCCSALTFLFWQSGKRVFLDRACINQRDNDMKVEALYSLAGMLDRSDAMLVLWDATYAERLWCVFELSAFLKSRRGQAKPLVVVPTLLGPVSVAFFLTVLASFIPIIALPLPADDSIAGNVAGFLALGVGGALATVHVLRGFYRSVETMQRQLLSLQLEELKCCCCSIGHVTDDGEAVLCDRQVICECIARWYGSDIDFASHIRTEVVEVITATLEKNTFGFSWGICVGAPACWAAMDLIQHELMWKQVAGSRIILWLELAVCSLLWLGPFLSWCKYLAFRFRQKCSSFLREILTNLAVILLALPLVLFIAGTFIFCWLYVRVLYGEWPMVAAFALIFFPGWAVMLFFDRRARGFLGRWLQRHRETGECAWIG